MSSARNLAQTDVIRPAWCLYGESARRRSRKWASVGMFGMAVLAFGCLLNYQPRTLAIPPQKRQDVVVMEMCRLLSRAEPVRKMEAHRLEKIVAERTDFHIENVKKTEPVIKKAPVPKPKVPVVKKEAPPARPRAEKDRAQPRKSVSHEKAAPMAAASPKAAEGAGKVAAPVPSAVPAKPAAPAPARPAAAGNTIPDADRSKVLANVLQAVERYKKYPKAARRSGAEGRLELTVRIGADGKIVSCSVTSPSNKAVLDAAGEQLGKKLTGLSVGARSAMSVVIPVTYRLTDN